MGLVRGRSPIVVRGRSQEERGVGDGSKGSKAARRRYDSGTTAAQNKSRESSRSPGRERLELRLRWTADHRGLSNFAWLRHRSAFGASRGPSSRRSLSTLARLSPETANLLRVTPVVRPATCRTPVGATRPVPPGHWPFSSTLLPFGRVGPPGAPPSVSVPPRGFPNPSDESDLAVGGFRVTGGSQYGRARQVSKGLKARLSTVREPLRHEKMTS